MSTPVTVPSLQKAKAEGRKLAMVTAYDAGFARAADAAGVDLLLVGDSLGMVVQGRDSTIPVTVDDIEYHTACVARGVTRSLIVADLPFQADAAESTALEAATRLLRAGAGMVKLEGAGFKCDIIRYLVEREIPVCGHLGLTPQSVLRMGGYRVQGKDEDGARLLIQQAREVEEAGATLLVLEGVPAQVGADVTAAVSIPTIGIGAGPEASGQVLVLHDLLGIDSGHRRPRFVRDFLADGGSIAGAFEAFVAAVRDGSFPGPEHCY